MGSVGSGIGADGGIGGLSGWSPFGYRLLVTER
jgi:hypothetical protein